MFLWDYILTFGLEVDLVWKSKWNFMKGLYLFQRYLPFTHLIWLGIFRQSYFISYLFVLNRLHRSNFEGEWVSESILC
jgi:hypothetical protein